MPNHSELQRRDEHGPVKSGVVFERTSATSGRVRIDRRTGLPLHPAEQAAADYHEHATVGDAALLARVLELETTLAAAEQAMAVKDQLADVLRGRIAELEALTANLSQRLAAASECLGRAAERRPEYAPPSLDELREYEGECV